MKVHHEIYKGLFAWTTAFLLAEPIVKMINGDIYKPNLVLRIICDYLYFTLIFLKAMFVYKHIFKKSEYFPDKDTSVKNITTFFAIFVGVQIIIDVCWAFMLQYLTAYIKILKIFSPYDRDFGVHFIINYTTHSASYLFLTMAIHLFLRDLEALGVIFFSLFTVFVISLQNSVSIKSTV